MIYTKPQQGAKEITMCPPPDRQERKDLSAKEVIYEIGKMVFGIGEYAVWVAKQKAAKAFGKKPAKPISFYF